MRNEAGMKFDCIFEEPLDFIDIDYTHLNKTIRYEQRLLKDQLNEDTIKLLKGIIDSYTNSPKGIFCKEVPITEQEIEAIKYVYNILKEGEDNEC